MPPRLRLALPFAAALGGCASLAPLDVWPGADPAALEGGGALWDHCWIEAGGRRLSLRTVEAAPLAWRGRRVKMRLTDPTVPYVCIGGAVYALQRARAKIVGQIGFISEPRRE